MTPRSNVASGTALPILAATFLLFTVPSQAQDFSCGNNELSRMGHLIEGHPERIAEIAQAEEEMEAYTAHFQVDAARGGNAYIIPVVFHIIHNNGPENISDEQVRDAIRVMNEDFNKQTPDWADVQPEFLDIVANVGFTFKLAQLDPDGNCTNGITRTESILTYQGDQDMKDLIDWPRNRYLNIWVAADLGGAAGYSMYPSTVNGPWGQGTDGIAVLATYVGSIGTSSLNNSHTLSHEAGHWMNLKHCWGDSNNPGLTSNCNIDDNVSDTPDTKGWTSCSLTAASCGSTKDNVENFMEYSYCSKMFTEGQKTRMTAALNSSTANRNNLWTPANLALTGLDSDPAICAVQFNSNTRTICQGQSIQYTDNSYNGVSEWNWNFAGGTPAAATEANPMVTYDTPGTYDVSLTVGNGSQTQSATQPQYVKVLPATGMVLPLAEGFEAVNSLPSDDWQVNDENSDGTFALSTEAAYSGSHSVRLHNASANNDRVDELFSNTIDASLDPPVTMSFRYAFARRISSNNDALRIYLSLDCGESWSLRRTLLTDALVTAPNT
ncbi:MAG: M43 family zinc metalloprotease, partial [Flavobacteriales bacterium]